MSLEDFITTVFCLVDDLLKKMMDGKKIRDRGFGPTLADSEIITMIVIAEFLGIDTDKGAWEYFCSHWVALFPNIGSRANFAKHIANLWWIMQKLVEYPSPIAGGQASKNGACNFHCTPLKPAPRGTSSNFVGQILYIFRFFFGHFEC